MPNFYVYLISSLPILHFGAKPNISFEKFLSLCQELIPGKDVEILKNIPNVITEEGIIHPTLKKWYEFEIALRNELVKVRASRKKIDTAKYLRNDVSSDSQIAHLSLAAWRGTSLMDGEKILDEGRWHYLDELGFGHYFDADFLIIYALKLLIVERWEKIRLQDKHKAMELVLSE